LSRIGKPRFGCLDDLADDTQGCVLAFDTLLQLIFQIDDIFGSSLYTDFEIFSVDANGEIYFNQ